MLLVPARFLRLGSLNQLQLNLLFLLLIHLWAPSILLLLLAYESTFIRLRLSTILLKVLITPLLALLLLHLTREKASERNLTRMMLISSWAAQGRLPLKWGVL